jgi:hypothetical protein
MSQEWLNGLSTLCIEKRLLNKIDIDTIIDDFASRNVRRKFWGNLICIQIISYEYYFCIQLLIVTFCIYVYIYCQWVLLVVLSCSYKEAQNFRFVLGQRKLRTGPGYKTTHAPPASTCITPHSIEHRQLLLLPFFRSTARSIELCCIASDRYWNFTS